jgi:hypothetical protein
MRSSERMYAECERENAGIEDVPAERRTAVNGT